MAAIRYRLLMALALTSISLVVIIVFSEEAFGTQAGQVRPMKPDVREIASPIKGLLLFLGSEINKGEPVKEVGRKLEVKMGKEVRTFLRLRVGDKVLPGQMIAQLDDSEVRKDIQLMEVKSNIAQLEWDAAKARMQRSQQLMDRLKKMKENGALDEPAYTEVLLYHAKVCQEVVQYQEAVKLARRALESAHITLQSHSIHWQSRRAGVVREIYKNHGEAVEALEKLIKIEVIE